MKQSRALTYEEATHRIGRIWMSVSYTHLIYYSYGQLAVKIVLPFTASQS